MLSGELLDKVVISTQEMLAAGAVDEARLPPSYLEDEALYRTLRQWFEVDASHSSQWRREAREDFDFVACEQWDENTRRELEAQQRPVITFNRVLAVIKAVAGIEINGRHETIFIPRGTDQGDVQINEFLTQASQWMADGCDAEDEESEAFQDALVCGMGWCLSDDAMVRLPNTHFATTRFYNGAVIEIDLENGHKLTGTPNHPVLTDRGWKRLHMLEEGDNLVNSSFLKRVQGFPVEQFDHVEARLKDKVDAFRTAGEASRLVTSANDFYGDGAGSDIHIVYADSALSRKFRDAARNQKLHQLRLAGRNLIAQCRAFLLRYGMQLHAATSTEGQAALSFAHSPSANLPCDYGVSGNSSGQESLADGFRVYAQALRDLARAEHLLGVEADYLRRVALGARSALAFSKIVARMSQSGTHGARGQANDPANFASVEALGEIELDKSFEAGLGRNASAAPSGAKRKSGLAKLPGDGSPRYSEFIPDFFDWKPSLEVEARNLLNGNENRALFTTRVIRKTSRDVEQFPVHDVGTSLGLFVAGDIVTSNTESILDYESDPEGRYVEVKVDPLEMYWDRDARSKNLIDARRVWRVRRMQLEEARAFVEGLGVNVPDSELSATWASHDGQDMDLPRPVEDRRLREENVALPHDPRAEVYIVQVQWWERERYWRVADFGSPQTQDLTEDQFKQFKQRARQLGVEIIAVPMTRRVYKQAFLGRTLLGPVRQAPAIDRFSFTCITGEKRRNKGTWFGLVRLMRDPQMWANKWLSQTLHILNTTAKGGIIAEGDAFEDQRQAEMSYAQPDSITWAAEGAIQKGKIMQKPGVGIPTAYVNLLEFAITSIRDTTGINMELLGMRDVNQPGILEAQRKQAALTILATIFDSLRRFRKEIGRIRLNYIQNYLSDGRLIRIAGPDGDGYQVVPLLRDKTIGQYDVIVDDAPTSPNQKDQTWGMLMQLMPVFKGMMTPEAALILLEYSPLPSKVVQAFKQLMEKPNPAQEAQQQLMLAHAKGEVDKLNADAQQSAAGAKLKLAQADKARVDAVLGMAQAATEGAQANLDQARADAYRADSAMFGNGLGENPFIVTPPQNMGQTVGQLPSLPQLPTATESQLFDMGELPQPPAPPSGPVPTPAGEAGGGLPI